MLEMKVEAREKGGHGKTRRKKEARFMLGLVLSFGRTFTMLMHAQTKYL